MTSHLIVMVGYFTLGHLSGDIDMIFAETSCSVRISYDTYGTPRVTICSEDGNRGLGRAREMVQDSIIEFLNDENSNGRLLYELATTASGSINFDHIRTSDGFVLQEKPNRVWMKLLELPYAESKGGRKQYHGKFLLNRQLQDEMIHGTQFVKRIRIYAFRDEFRNDEPIWCKPYILISGQRKEEVVIVAERVDEKLRTFAADKPYLIYT
jgi:protein involved in ribonucleotide reduction